MELGHLRAEELEVHVQDGEARLDRADARNVVIRLGKDDAHDYSEPAVGLARRLISTLDHGKQIENICAQLETQRKEGKNLLAAICVACSEQDPRYLAEHLFIELHRNSPEPLRGSNANWLHDHLPVQFGWDDKDAFARRLTDSLGGQNLEAAARKLTSSHRHHCVLCVTFRANQQGHLSLPERMADAYSVLQQLHAYMPEIPLVALFICLVGHSRPRWLNWLSCNPSPWWHGLLRARLGRTLGHCLWTDPPEPLGRDHIEAWQRPPLHEVADDAHHECLRDELRKVWRKQSDGRGRPSYMDLELGLADAIAKLRLQPDPPPAPHQAHPNPGPDYA